MFVINYVKALCCMYVCAVVLEGNIYIDTHKNMRWMLKELYKNCFGITEEKAISFMYLCEDKMVLKITKEKTFKRSFQEWRWGMTSTE